MAITITEYMYGKCMHRIASYKNTEHLKNEQHPWVYWKKYLQGSETVVMVSSLSWGARIKTWPLLETGFALAHLRRGCELVPLEQVTGGPAEKQSCGGQV